MNKKSEFTLINFKNKSLKQKGGYGSA